MTDRWNEYLKYFLHTAYMRANKHKSFHCIEGIPNDLPGLNVAANWCKMHNAMLFYPNQSRTVMQILANLLPTILAFHCLFDNGILTSKCENYK